MMRLSSLYCLSVSLLAWLGGAGPAQTSPLHPNALHNGGFERGDFRDWTLSGNTQYSQVFSQPYDGLAARGGVSYALLGAQGSDGILSQSFADVAGQTLRVSFWLASNGGTTDDFSAWLDGARFMAVTDTGAFGWTRYETNFTATGTDTLSFEFRDDQAYLALDRVRILPASAVGPAGEAVSIIPEPASVAILAPVALAAIAFARRREKMGVWGLRPQRVKGRALALTCFPQPVVSERPTQPHDHNI